MNMRLNPYYMLRDKKRNWDIHLFFLYLGMLSLRMGCLAGKNGVKKLSSSPPLLLVWCISLFLSTKTRVI